MEDKNKEKELQKQLEQEVETRETKKMRKRFTKVQGIALLAITLFLSTGGGLALGNFYFWDSAESNRINEQLDYYQERVRLSPNSLPDRIVLGYTYYLKGDNNRAVSEFNYVLDQDENYYDAYYNLGLVYLDEEKYDNALSMFNKTVQIAPKDYKGHFQMGVTYRHMGMDDEALESLVEANLIFPANSDIIYEIGAVAEAKEEYQSAAEIYKDALQYDPLFEKALVALERLEDNELKEVGE
ncbi:tetratricopeptide repeat protein [Bacillaceae bacterium IKA-2]|nr:tetratricopeptide repeat protein [Bacillaceae bacterium IKA-2]